MFSLRNLLQRLRKHNQPVMLDEFSISGPSHAYIVSEKGIEKVTVYPTRDEDGNLSPTTVSEGFLN